MDQPSDFCPQCGNLVDIPLYGDCIECTKCSSKFSILEHNFKPIITTIEFTEEKQWLQQYDEKYKNQVQQQNKQQQEENKQGKATIKQECPKCGHDTMYFYTLQLRSADEGSTVFYECMKCHFKFSQNN